MDALILVNNAMRSGLDIASGIELITTNLKPPISEEFGTVLNTYRLGGSLESALSDMTRRIRSRSLETAVGAILIQREMGGNLVKTFEQLIQTIREESKLQKKVQALSAQGRTQIAFLAVFPWGLALLFYMLSPDMIGPALRNPLGQVILIGLIIWEGIGILVTKRIVTVDV
jgi:tight adherence protein B